MKKSMTILTAGAAFALAGCQAATPPSGIDPAAGITLANSAPVAREVSVPGPQGPLAGTLIGTGEGAPAVLILPGSGPTDRNGDNPIGASGGVLRQLAEGLAAKGISSLRVDKRGMFGSKAAIADANEVRIADYVADTAKWSQLLRNDGHPCVWIAGHSEGSLVALASAATVRPCGLILIGAPGRPLADVIRDQLRPQLPPAMMQSAEGALVRLESGKRVDPKDVPGPLMGLFNPAVQGYLIDIFRYRPAELAARLSVPLLIVHGEEDLQVSIADARTLAAARPEAKLVLLNGVNHVLKSVPKGDPAANLKSYTDADARIDPRVVDAIVDFINSEGR